MKEMKMFRLGRRAGTHERNEPRAHVPVSVRNVRNDPAI